MAGIAKDAVVEEYEDEEYVEGEGKSSILRFVQELPLDVPPQLTRRTYASARSSL